MSVLHLFKFCGSSIHSDFYVAHFNIGIYSLSVIRPWILAQMMDKEYCQAKKVCQDGLKQYFYFIKESAGRESFCITRITDFLVNSRREKGEASLSISLGHSLPTMGLLFYIFFLFCINPISGPMSLFEILFAEKSYKTNYNFRGGGGVGVTPWYSSKSTHTIVSNQSNSNNNNEDNGSFNI